MPGSTVSDYFKLNGGLIRSSASYAIDPSRGITLGTNGGGFDNATAGALTYNGVIAGGAGTGDLTKIGGQTLILGGTNTYSGATNVNAGTLSVSSITDNLGTNSTVNLGSAATGGNLTYTGTGSDETTSKVVNLAGTTGGAFLIQSGTNNLKFTSDLTATGAGAKTLTLQGSTAGTGEIAGAIVDNSGTNTTAVTKTGSGTWVLSGANTYSGGTTISNGTLLANNTAPLSSATGSGAVVVSAGTLGGNGAMSGGVTLNGGTLSPGTSSGNIAALGTGALSFNSGSTFAYELDSNASPTPAADLINAAGALNIALSGAALTIADLGNTVLPANTKFTLISYSGTWNGNTFDTYADDSTITVGADQFVLNYNDTSAGSVNGGSFTNAVTLTLTAVPEANAFWLGGALCLVVGLTVGTRKMLGKRAAV